MSMADVIKSIECGAFREIQPNKIGGRNGEPIDCSTLEDEPVIVADNEADRQTLRDYFKGVRLWKYQKWITALKKCVNVTSLMIIKRK